MLLLTVRWRDCLALLLPEVRAVLEPPVPRALESGSQAPMHQGLNCAGGALA